MKGKRENEVAQSCLTLSDPMDCSLPDSSIHGIFQARVLEWGAIALQQSMAKELDMTERLHFDFTFMHWRRKWQPTPVFLPGESQGRGSLVGCRLWDRIESDMTEVT